MNKKSRLDRSSYMLAVLSCMNDIPFSPLQAQKIFFLLDRNIDKNIGGTYFNFEPYHYGPFDKNVYIGLNKLVGSTDLVSKYTGVRWYSLTKNGKKKAKTYLDTFDKKTQDYFNEICKFVTSLSFEQLLSAIYQKYPEMKAKSIFRS